MTVHKHVSPLDLIIRVAHSNIVSAIAATSVGVLTARLLGPSGRGNYAIFVTTISFVSSVGMMGLYHSGVYYISKSKISPSEALGSVLLLALANLVILPIAMPFFLPLLGPGSAVFDNIWVRAAFVLACVFLVLREGFGGVVMALKNYSTYTNQLIIEPVLVLCATFLLFATQRTGDVAIYLRTAGAGLAMIVMVWNLLRVAPMKPEFSFSTMRREVLFGIQAVVQNVLTQLNFRVYIYFLAGISAKAAGWYSIALLFCELVRFVPNAIGGALFPFMSGQTTQEAGRMASKACRHMFAIGFCIAIIFNLFSAKIVTLMFGAAFQPAALAAAMMVWGAVVGSLYMSLTSYFTGAGRQDVTIAASGGGLVVGLATAAIAIPRFGVNGAGFAYMVSSVAVSGISVFKFWQMTGHGPMSLLILRRDEILRISDIATNYFLSAPRTPSDKREL